MKRIFEYTTGLIDRLHAIHPALPWFLSFVILCGLPFVTVNDYQIYLMNFIGIMIILVIGLNIVKGFAGQVTVGHIGLYAVGAYASGVLSVNFGVPFWLALPAAIAITALAGAIVGIPSFRLEGAYLALATLGFAESVRIYLLVTNYFGSSSGFAGIPAPGIGGFQLDTYLEYYYLVLPITLLAIYISFAILKSATGRAFMAIREDTVSAAASGINVIKYKSIAFILSAAYAGCAGSLFAHMSPGYIHPNNFTVIEMVTLLLMVVLGGIGHIWGGIIGAVIVTIIFDLTRDWYFYQMLMFGAVIVATVLFMPKGIGGVIDRYLVTQRFIAAREQGRERSTDAAGVAGRENY
jgi:branched-chain amino acid transport system permease protein